MEYRLEKNLEKYEVGATLLTDIGLNENQRNYVIGFIDRFLSSHSYGWQRSIEDGSSKVVNKNGQWGLQVSSSSSSYDCFSGSARLLNHIFSSSINDNFNIGIYAAEAKPMDKHYRFFIQNRSTHNNVAIDLTPIFPLFSDVDAQDLDERTILQTLNQGFNLSSEKQSLLSLKKGIILNSDSRSSFTAISIAKSSTLQLPSLKFHLYDIAKGLGPLIKGNYSINPEDKSIKIDNIKMLEAYGDWDNLIGSAWGNFTSRPTRVLIEEGKSAAAIVLGQILLIQETA